MLILFAICTLSSYQSRISSHLFRQNRNFDDKSNVGVENVRRRSS